jgi:hypothetical protein
MLIKTFRGLSKYGYGKEWRLAGVDVVNTK